MSHTLGLPFALGTLFLEKLGWYVEKLYVTLRYQVHSVNQYLMVHGIFPWSFCVQCGSLLPMQHVSVILSRVLNKGRCIFYATYFNFERQFYKLQGFKCLYVYMCKIGETLIKLCYVMLC